jgi:hypothetical protein
MFQILRDCRTSSDGRATRMGKNADILSSGNFSNLYMQVALCLKGRIVCRNTISSLQEKFFKK